MAFGKGSGDSLDPDAPFLGNPITQWKEDTDVFPSNSQQWWVYKRPVILRSEDAPRQYLEVFDTDMRHQLTTGNTSAPRGHYIYDAFRIDRETATGITGLPLETSQGARPSCTAFYAGRAFYAGTKANRYNTRIYFSQIIERPDQVGSCYQSYDLTDEDIPDLLPSDGGVVVIPEVSEIVHLFPKGDSLLVFATNGVWQIAGSEGVGFRANDYSVTKITDTPALSRTSFVSVDGNPVWWNRSGIWTLTPQQGGISYQLQSLTDGSIKSFFQDEISADSKRWAKGAYNHQTKIVQWVYNDTAPGTPQERFKYNRILNFNTLTGAFYPWRIGGDTSTVFIQGIFATDGVATRQQGYNVVVGGDPVVVGADPVTVSIVVREQVDSRFKYTTAVVST